VIFEDVLRALLIQVNLVGPRVYLMRAPQKPTVTPMEPYMVFLNVGPVPLHSITAPLDVLQREYQITTFDTSQSRAIGIADALRTRIDGMRGDYMGIRFGAILFRFQTSGYENDTELHSIVTSFEILFQYLDDFQAFDQQRQQQRQQIRK
jgi:hypothetical protein